MPRPLILAAAAALLAAAPAAAQEPEPAAADSLAEAVDSADAEPADTAPGRPRGRWSTPFAVEGAGRASIERDPRPDVVRWDAPRRPVVAAAPPADSLPTLAIDSAPPRPARTAAADSVRTARPAAPPAAGRAPAAGRTAATPPRTPARPRTHTVEAGETFFGIARRYGLTAAALRAANPDARWESVRIGEELRIPPAPRTAATPTRPGAGGRSAAGRRTATARRVHVVERGETLFGIARRYNVRARQIQDANDMRGDQVRIGQRLVIPAP